MKSVWIRFAFMSPFTATGLVLGRSYLTKALRATRTHLPVAFSSRALSMTASSPFDASGYFTATSPAETKDFIMQQTMIRVKEPQRSLDFYTKVLGMQLIMYREFPQWKFNVYFVAFVDPNSIPTNPDQQWQLCMRTPGCIELTWNYGTENDEADRVYNTGNGDITGTTSDTVKGGFGHLGITVPDVYESCARFADLGVEFTKTPNAGGMKGLAFIKDPDGYLIEILPQGTMMTKAIDHAGVSIDGGDGYVDNSKK